MASRSDLIERAARRMFDVDLAAYGPTPPAWDTLGRGQEPYMRMAEAAWQAFEESIPDLGAIG